MQVTVLGVSGSPRKGATQFAVQEALRAASEIEGAKTQFLDLKGKEIHHCIHCDRCIREQVDYCPAFSDDMGEFYPLLLSAHGWIFGSPVYQMNPTGLIQTFINRLRPIAPYIGKGHYATRVGGSIAVGGTRHGGQETTLESLNNALFCIGMVVVSGGIYAYNGGAVWSRDRKEQGAREDEIGLSTVRVIGRRVAMTARLLALGLEHLPEKPDPGILVGFSSQEELEERRAAFRKSREA